MRRRKKVESLMLMMASRARRIQQQRGHGSLVFFLSHAAKCAAAGLSDDERFLLVLAAFGSSRSFCRRQELEFYVEATLYSTWPRFWLSTRTRVNFTGPFSIHSIRLFAWRATPTGRVQEALFRSTLLLRSQPAPEGSGCNVVPFLSCDNSMIKQSLPQAQSYYPLYHPKTSVLCNAMDTEYV